jgi:hypothetical protein
MPSAVPLWRAWPTSLATCAVRVTAGKTLPAQLSAKRLEKGLFFRLRSHRVACYNPILVYSAAIGKVAQPSTEAGRRAATGGWNWLADHASGFSGRTRGCDSLHVSIWRRSSAAIPTPIATAATDQPQRTGLPAEAVCEDAAREVGGDSAPWGKPRPPKCAASTQTKWRLGKKAALGR